MRGSCDCELLQAMGCETYEIGVRDRFQTPGAQEPGDGGRPGAGEQLGGARQVTVDRKRRERPDGGGRHRLGNLGPRHAPVPRLRPRKLYAG